MTKTASESPFRAEQEVWLYDSSGSERRRTRVKVHRAGRKYAVILRFGRELEFDKFTGRQANDPNPRKSLKTEHDGGPGRAPERRPHRHLGRGDSPALRDLRRRLSDRHPGRHRLRTAPGQVSRHCGTDCTGG